MLFCKAVTSQYIFLVLKSVNTFFRLENNDKVIQVLLHASHTSPKCGTCPAHFILLDLLIPITLGGKYKL
jgi:hypothetical protein